MDHASYPTSEFYRRAVIAGCLGMTFCIAYAGACAFFTHPSPDKVALFWDIGFLTAVCCLPFSLVAYYCHRRRSYLAGRVVVGLVLLITVTRGSRVLENWTGWPDKHDVSEVHSLKDSLWMYVPELPLLAAIAGLFLYLRWLEPRWFKVPWTGPAR